MKFDQKILSSKVSRRIFFLFVSCALLPVIVLTVFASVFIGNELREEAGEQLHRKTKSIAMGIIGRLTVVESELRAVALLVDSNRRVDLGVFWEHLEEHVLTLAIVSEQGVDVLFGEPNSSLPSLPDTWPAGHLLEISEGPGSRRLRLVIPIEREGLAPAMLVGQIHPDYLWSLEGGLELDAETDLWVLDAEQNALFASTGISLPPSALEAVRENLFGDFVWSADGADALAYFWSLHTRPHYGYPHLTVVLSEPEDQVLAPLAKVRKLLPMIVALSLLVVLLASVVQIRRSLVPIASLKEVTTQIAASRFDVRVSIDSQDEFQELGESFNAMAARIGEQFDTLSTLAAFDREILSTLKEQEIVEAVLARAPERLRCDSLAVTLVDRTERNSVQSCARWVRQETRRTETAVLPLPERRRLIETDAAVRFSREQLPAHLAGVLDECTVECIAFPIFRDEVAGCITLGFNRNRQHPEELVTEARRLTDQVAVALSNARLVDQLEETNWETLYALARAVDANSPWTAGHSERVTKMTLRIATRLKLPESELITLQKGGLLHDVGKIGVPNEILDKPGALTDEEMALMREHTTIGARILEPISAYRAELPIVLHHHEHFDGNGYPHGLAGEEIPRHARILAVADVYDALSSERPYREAWSTERCVGFIRSRAATQFDPEVVWAFLDVMEGSTDTQEEEPWVVPGEEERLPESQRSGSSSA